MNQNTNTKSKQHYATPVLKVHGTVQDMTKGAGVPLGSGSDAQCPPGFILDGDICFSIDQL